MTKMRPQYTVGLTFRPRLRSVQVKMELEGTRYRADVIEPDHFQRVARSSAPHPYGAASHRLSLVRHRDMCRAPLAMVLGTTTAITAKSTQA